MANSRGRSPVSANLPSVLEVLRAATAGAGRVVRYPAGNTLTVEGAPAADVHVILSGAVKLVRTVADSRDVTIGIRSSGWVLGLAAAILGVPHPCRAVTMVSSEMSIVPADSFKELVLRDARGQSGDCMAPVT